MKVLIAIDGSECSKAALQSVSERQWSEDTEFMVLSVIEPPYMEYGLYPTPEGIIDTIRQHLDRLVSCDVAILKSKFLKSKVTGKVTEGPVRYTIAETAQEWGADLIVMGSHGRRGLSKLLLGSIAEGVLQLSPCSVEIIREKREEKPKNESAKATEKSSDRVKTCDRVV